MAPSRSNNRRRYRATTAAADIVPDTSRDVIIGGVVRYRKNLSANEDFIRHLGPFCQHLQKLPRTDRDTALSDHVQHFLHQTNPPRVIYYSSKSSKSSKSSLSHNNDETLSRLSLVQALPYIKGWYNQAVRDFRHGDGVFGSSSSSRSHNVGQRQHQQQQQHEEPSSEGSTSSSSSHGNEHDNEQEGPSQTSSCYRGQGDETSIFRRSRRSNVDAVQRSSNAPCRAVSSAAVAAAGAAGAAALSEANEEDGTNNIPTRSSSSSFEDWNTDQVVQWLEATNPVFKTKYEAAFREEGVDGKMLSYMDDSTLEDELGVHSKLHRKRILGAIPERTRTKMEGTDTVKAEVKSTSSASFSRVRTANEIVNEKFQEAERKGKMIRLD